MISISKDLVSIGRQIQMDKKQMVFGLTRMGLEVLILRMFGKDPSVHPFAV